MPKPLLPSTLAHAVLVAATALPAAAQQADPPASQEPAPPAQADTIVITGKRALQARETPGSITALGSAQLEALGAQSLADYIQHVPGVVFNQYQPGVSHVVLRGIATSSGNVQGQPTTGYFLNEVPLNEPDWSLVIPDIDAFDLARVEVMRGPQGTLFGSGAMGGAVQYVANLADVHRFDAAGELTLAQTRNAELSHAVKGMINLPLQADTLAVRGVLSWRNDAGYLDNIGTGEDGSNRSQVQGGRLSAVLVPRAGTRLSWLSMQQNQDADDAAYRQQGLGDLQRSTATAEFTDTRVGVHTLRWDQDLPGMRLAVIAAHQTKQQDWRFDFTPLRDAYNADLQLGLVNPLYINSGGKSHSNSVEARLASAPGASVEWLLGAMAFDTEKDLYEQIAAEGAAAAFDASPLFGPGSGAVIAPDGRVFNAFYTAVQARETALFGEASIPVADRLKLTLGGRLFHTEVEQTTTQVGFSTYPGDPVRTRSTASERGFNPKLALSFTHSPDLMFYALASEGFRFGVANTQGLSAYPVPQASRSDSLRNYELGLRAGRGEWLVDATLFRVDWRDIQLRLQTPDFYNYATNGGRASSTGVELSTRWRPNSQVDWQSSVTYQQARLDEPLEILWAGTAPKGARLPGSSDWVVSNSLAWRLDGGQRVQLSHQYVSSGLSDLASTVPGATRNRQGGYNTLDLRYAMPLGDVDLTFFASNLLDERGVTRTVAETNGIGEGIVRPRTLGVTLSWRQ